MPGSSLTLTILRIRIEYTITKINDPSVSWLILSSSNVLTICEVYFVVNSCRVTRVAEKVTPRIGVNPPDIVKSIL
jgi:hypothetical protein